LIKTTCQHLLLLVGFDTLIYRKYYDTPPILVGHHEDGKKRSSSPHSIANTWRNTLGKRAAKDLKGKKTRDDDIANAMGRIAKARLQANEDRKLARSLDNEVEARRAALEESIAANEERRLALEEKKVANEDRRLALEEKKVANEEHQRLVEEERKLFLMDTYYMDERQKEYINLAHDEVLAKKNIGNQHECTFGQLWRHGSTGGCLWRRLWRHGSTGGCVWRRHGRNGMYGKHGRHGRHVIGWLCRRLWRDKCTDGRHGSTGEVLWKHGSTTGGILLLHLSLHYLVQVMVPMEKNQKMEMAITLKMSTSDDVFAWV
jgi:hypothetical protein